MNESFSIPSAQMQAISDKIAGLTTWLVENAPQCEAAQKHLEEGSVERAYWHYGYLCALRDVASVINRNG